MTSAEYSNSRSKPFLLFFLKKWANPGLFSFIFGHLKQTLQIFTTNRFEKMSIQYTEHTTFGTWVSSHNH